MVASVVCPTGVGRVLLMLATRVAVIPNGCPFGIRAPSAGRGDSARVFGKLAC